MSYVATRPTFGPLLILPPPPKRWGPPNRQGFCSQQAHFWATCCFACPSEALRTPHGAGVMCPPGSFVATTHFVPRDAMLGTPSPCDMGYVATRPICGPLLILSPTQKRWGPPRRQGLCISFCSLLCSIGPPPHDKGYVATCPTCAAVLILSPAVKCWLPPRRQGLCSQPAHFWAISDFVACCAAFGTPRTASVM